MSEIKDWGNEHGQVGDSITSGHSGETLSRRGMLAMQGEAKSETPQLNPDLYTARVYRTDMLSSFDVRFLSQDEVTNEKIDPNQTPSFRMTISNPNVMADLAEYVQNDPDQNSVLNIIAQKYGDTKTFQFNVKVYVGYGELPIKRKNKSDRLEPHVIQIAWQDQKMHAASDSLKVDELDFCLSLLQRSLNSSVSQMETPDMSYHFKAGTKDDQIVAESMVHGKHEQYAKKLSYISACLAEAQNNLEK